MSDSIIPIDSTDTSDHGQSSNELPLCKMKTPTTLTALEDAYFKRLLGILENGKSEDFLIMYSSTDSLQAYNDIQIELFIKAIDQKSNDDVVEKILSNITDIEYIRELAMGCRNYKTTIIENICEARNLEAFRNLLSLKHLKKPRTIKILHTLISCLDENLFHLWFDILYDFYKFDVNEVYDNCTLLDKAHSLGKKPVIRKLLEAGIYIGNESYFNESNSQHKFTLDPLIIEECFDSCINGALDSHKYISFNYKNLMPPKSQSDLNEMNPIKLIMNSKEHLHLIKHPLITSFMALKWQRQSKYLCLNLLLYCFYLISIVWYIILTTRNQKESDFTNLTWWFTIFGTVYLIVREAIQFRFPIEYLKKKSNYLEIGLIIFSISIITVKPLDEEIIVGGIILIALEFWVLVANLPILSFSIHMNMLEEVLKTFLKSFSLYAIFVLTFALSFFVLFGSEGQFENIFKSVIRTMAMVIGELNIDDLKLEGVCSYVLILLFIISMTVVLINLLNGLAVSDIQVIRQHAELNGLIFRAKFLYTHDFKLLIPKQIQIPKLLIDKNEGEQRSCNCNLLVSGVYLTDKAHSNKIILPFKCCLCQNQDDENNTNSEKWICWSRFCKVTNLWQTFDILMGNGIVMKSSIKEAKTVLRNKGSAKNVEINQLEILELTVEDIKNKSENMEEKIQHIYEESFIIEKQVQSIEQNVKNMEKEQYNIGKNIEKILKNMQKEDFEMIPPKFPYFLDQKKN